MAAGGVLVLVLLAGCGRIGFDVHADGSLDGTADAAPCTQALDPSTVALYSFDSGAAADATGDHDGTVIGPLALVDGVCGSAVRFPAGASILVPDSPAFDLASGSIEVSIRTPMPVPGTPLSWFGRDAGLTANDGHIMGAIADDGDILVRIQRGDISYFRCAPGIAANTWAHIGISFGDGPSEGFRVWVDHVEATLTSVVFQTSLVTCGSALTPGGITGNDNTLVMGGNNTTSAEGDPAPIVYAPFIDSDVDQLQIRSTWRDFSILDHPVACDRDDDHSRSRYV